MARAKIEISTMNDITKMETPNPLDPAFLRKTLSDEPGVYLYKDHDDAVIYVGKAKNLKKRVLSYFRPAKDLPHKTAVMMERVRHLDFMLTSTEQEAFILERNLIKKYMPRYNIILRDDKQYPCLKLDVKEPYPRLQIVRKMKKDGSLYFGPFSSANAVRSTHRLIDRIFKLRKCSNRKFKVRTRPCLNFQMNRCLGPCANAVPVADYGKIVNQIRLLLEGRDRELIRTLRDEMEHFSSRLDFENAARTRDQIGDIEKTLEKQHVVSQGMEDQDIIAVVQSGLFHQLAVLFVRGGRLIENRSFFFEDTGTSAEVLEAFLKQYYPEKAFIPSTILLSENVPDQDPIAAWLSDLAGKKVAIHTPRRGSKARLVDIARTNAEKTLTGRLESEKQNLMILVKSTIGLQKTPVFIEALDISNFQGDMAVGAVVSFAEGEPNKKGYRNFRMKSVVGIDDYGMMAELITRRVKQGNLPDIFLVDGGRGHLAAVKHGLEAQIGKASKGIFPSHIPEVISIAKPDEARQETCDKIYISGRKNPLNLRAGHPVLLLMMRIRDEVHRRAIGYHRKLRRNNLTTSQLNGIPGIGEKRKKILLQYFKDINAISSASLEEMEQVPGFSRALSESVYRFFHEDV